MKKAKATAGQFNLTLELCRDLNIPICSLAEQLELDKRLQMKLSQIQKLEEVIACSLAKVEALRRAILLAAFSGKLVPQDPNDEPASVLLERIRAEHEANASKPKKTTKHSKEEAA